MTNRAPKPPTSPEPGHVDVHGPAETEPEDGAATTVVRLELAHAVADGLPVLGPDLTTPRGRRAVIYCRISRADADDDSARERQEMDCRSYCAAMGWDVVAVHWDRSKSAFKRGLYRPEWERTLAMAEAEEIDVLVAWHADRLSRNDELERLIDVVDRTKLSVACVTDSGFDLRTPGGRLVARILNNLARHESEHKSNRILASVDQMRAAGRRANGGTRQFGFEADGRTVRPAERDALVWAAESIVDGATLRSTARAMPLPPTIARTWAPSSLRQALLRPSTAGLVESHQRGVREDGSVGRTGAVVLVDGDFPALLPRELWERVSVVLSDPARKTWKPSRGYVLSGGLALDRYGRNLMGRTHDGGRRIYWVGPDGANGERLGSTKIGAEPLESLVTEALLARADAMRLLMQRGATSRPAQDLAARRAELETERAEIHGDLRANRIGRTEFRALAQDLAQDEARLEADERAAMAETGRSKVAERLAQPGALRDAWPALMASKRTAILRAELEHVAVGPGERRARGFVPERVTIRWADGTETNGADVGSEHVEPMAEPRAVATVSRVVASHLAEVP